MNRRSYIPRVFLTSLLVLPAAALLGFDIASGWAQEPAPAPETQPAEPAKLFPDPALEAAVRQEVYAKRNNQEPLTVEDVKDVSRVVANGKGIKSLEGLQHCVSLRLLRLTDNEITDVTPIAGLKLLLTVDLNKNQVEDISSLGELTAVQLLDLSGNKVKNIEVVKQMTNMRSLWLADNQIESLEPIAGLGKVGSLDLAGNGLEDAALAPIGQLSWLTHVDLDRNQITSLESLRPLNRLSMVLLRENKIKDLTPLVEMCRKDTEGEKRFAPYLEVYVRGNPLSPEAMGPQLDQLREMGVDVELK